MWRHSTHKHRASSAWHLLPGGLAFLLFWSANSALSLESYDAAQLLKKADGLKSTQNSEFRTILDQLAEHSNDLSPLQQQYLRYFKGWQTAYEGNYDASIALLEATIAQSTNVTLRFRALATMVNVLSIAKHYEEAFSQLRRLLELLPRVSDRHAREQGLGVAALLYNQVGQYDLGLRYAKQLADEHVTGRGACTSAQLTLEALYRSGKLETAGREFQAGIDTCSDAGEIIFANLIRTYAAKSQLDQGKVAEAIRLLEDHYEDVRRTRYPRLITAYEVVLAQGYRQRGNRTKARQLALRVTESGDARQYTEPLVAAYRLLYLLARDEGDVRTALAFFEKYVAADKGHLDDVTTRQLAFERMNHEAIANKLQIDALNKQNEVLRLQRALDRKAAETSRLYITLLLMVVAFIAFFAYRIKRSQLHFMRLSRVDGLTGIANRPHFIEQAERALEHSRRTQQEVCIVLCDLDHFKSINDKYGHATGDFVLRQAVTACRSHLRAGDLFGRFGGEEFGFLLPGCSPADAGRRAEQLRIAILGVAAHHGSLVTAVSASFGVAGNGSSGYELRQLLAHADAALYKAKHAGRNCVVLYKATGDVEGPLPTHRIPDEPARGVGHG